MAENNVNQAKTKVADKEQSSQSSSGEQNQQSEMNFQNVTEACQGIKQEFAYSFSKWAAAFQESEKIDMFFEKRLDELIQEAEKAEDILKSQKAALKEKLRCLTKTLNQVVENES
ncbi:uncharacterized protein [Clytia hemisphaerica]